jgi:hypothetical protein
VATLVTLAKGLRLHDLIVVGEVRLGMANANGVQFVS